MSNSLVTKLKITYSVAHPTIHTNQLFENLFPKKYNAITHLKSKSKSPINTKYRGKIVGETSHTVVICYANLSDPTKN